MKPVSTATLEAFAKALYVAAGMPADKAASVAWLQVLTDAMGRRTHGIAMAPLYLAEIAKGTLATAGDVEVVSDNGVCAVWDGRYLPGLWVIERAIATASPRARQHGVAIVSVRRSHHIGCLAALASLATEQGLIAQIANSDPAGRRVAPYGGTEALFTPNPYALGYPGHPNAVLVDICASITTTSMTRQKVAAGEHFEHPWLLDAEGRPTTDPAVLEQREPRGSLQLIGGAEYGHKGFGLGLVVEALSQGLSGHGRKDAPKRWGGSTFVQLIDPERFAGLAAFEEQMDHLGDACRRNRPVDPARPVRLPGDQAARGVAEARERGIAYDEATWAALERCAAELGVRMPESA